MAVVDDNFEDFVSNWDLFRERLVVFLGAGASIGAANQKGDGLLNAYQLRNALWQRFKHPTGTPFDPASLGLMTLDHSAAIIEAKTGRTPLNEYLIEQFTCEKPLWQHATLRYLRPKSLFTTNYDELVELGYSATPGPMLDIICNDRQAIEGRTCLYKPHGSLTHAREPVGKGGLVITQFDYLEMIADYRKMLEKAMTGFDRTCVLIIGYSFGDMDIGSQLYSLRQKTPGIPWYAVFPRNDPQVRKMYSKRFGIEQIDARFEEFLAELDARVSFLPAEWKHSNKNTLAANGIIQG